MGVWVGVVQHRFLEYRVLYLSTLYPPSNPPSHPATHPATHSPTQPATHPTHDSLVAGQKYERVVGHAQPRQRPQDLARASCRAKRKRQGKARSKARSKVKAEHYYNSAPPTYQQHYRGPWSLPA
jgi:hypothetical protein